MKNVGGVFLITLKNGDLYTVPNQFTIAGMQQVLAAAFHQIPFEWEVGLCAHNPADSIALPNVVEPTSANGYARQTLNGDSGDWPLISTVNGESYVESREFEFTATGAYDSPTNRLFLTDGVNVMAISSPISDSLNYVEENLATKYRLYFR